MSSAPVFVILPACAEKLLLCILVLGFQRMVFVFVVVAAVLAVVVVVAGHPGFQDRVKLLMVVAAVIIASAFCFVYQSLLLCI